MSAFFRSIAFALPMTSMSGGGTLRTLSIEMVFRIVIGGFWGSLLQAFRGAQPPWLASFSVAVVLPAAALWLEYVALQAGHATHIKTGMIVSVIVSVGSLLLNLGLMRRGLLVTGEEGDSFCSDLRRLPSAIGSMFRGVSRNA
jgi:hypothetical protein